MEHVADHWDADPSQMQPLFDKQALLWEKARLRTPEHFERWSLVVAMAHNQLVLARSLVKPELRPWENKQRVPTPQQVRRGRRISRRDGRKLNVLYHPDERFFKNVREARSFCVA